MSICYLNLRLLNSLFPKSDNSFFQIILIYNIKCKKMNIKAQIRGYQCESSKFVKQKLICMNIEILQEI